MEDIHEGQDRYYGALRSDYELLKQAIPHHDELQRSVGEEIGAMLQAKKLRSSQILDIGTGTGVTAEAILKTTEDSRLFSIDSDPIAIGQAKENLAQWEQRITLIAEDALRALSGFSDASFDAVGSCFTIHNMPPAYRRNLFREIYRVLKAESLFVNADKIACNNLEEHNGSLKRQLEQFRSIYTKAGRPDLEQKSTQHYLQDEKFKLTEEEHISLLQAVGFQDIRILRRMGMEAVIRATKG